MFFLLCQIKFILFYIYIKKYIKKDYRPHFGGGIGIHKTAVGLASLPHCGACPGAEMIKIAFDRHLVPVSYTHLRAHETGT